MGKADHKLMNLWFILTQREYFLSVCCACTDWDLSPPSPKKNLERKEKKKKNPRVSCCNLEYGF